MKRMPFFMALLIISFSSAYAQYNVTTVSGITSAMTNSMLQNYPKWHSGYRGPLSNYGSVELATVPVPSIYKVTGKFAPNSSLATHTFLLVRNANGITERVIEGKAEKLINGSELFFGYGRLIARTAKTKAALGLTVSPMLERVENPFGDTSAGFLMFKNKIMMATNKFQYQSQTVGFGIGYYPIPELQPGSGNSNSLIGSILRQSGSFIPSPFPSAYGWDVNVIQ